MPVNIYVGNLPWQTTGDDLFQLFAPYGQVGKTQVVSDRETGRSRGFGFVEMASEADATAAIEALHDFSYNGRPLTVNVAKPREPAGGRGGYSGPAAGSEGGYGADRGRYGSGGRT